MVDFAKKLSKEGLKLLLEKKEQERFELQQCMPDLEYDTERCSQCQQRIESIENNIMKYKNLLEQRN